MTSRRSRERRGSWASRAAGRALALWVSPSLPIYSIGHSTRSIEELLEVLAAHGIEAVLDVRRFPGSRRLPQFESAALAASLAARDIGYHWIPELGGRRKPNADSPNVGWRHLAFRAYADHMATEEFAAGLFDLLMLARGVRSAVMCAEVLWWRCHRRIIADVLVSIGERVFHIADMTTPEEHQLAPPARIVRGVLTYDPSR
jgi:uncharacterized protein (DUF488 family)